jgi:hypothetical protein
MPNAYTSAAVLILPHRSSSGLIMVIVPNVRVSRCVAPSVSTRDIPKSETLQTRPKGAPGALHSRMLAACVCVWGV